MKILLSSVKERSKDFQFQEAFVLQGLEERVKEGRVDLRVQVDPAGERWYLYAKIDAVFPFVCDRCGDLVTGKLKGEFKLIVLDKTVGGLDPDESDEVVLLPPDSREIDLHDRVAETLWLEMPIQLNCVAMGEDPCAKYRAVTADDPSSGKREQSVEEIDPRWRVLKELKLKMQQGPAEEAETPESED